MFDDDRARKKSAAKASTSGRGQSTKAATPARAAAAGTPSGSAASGQEGAAAAKPLKGGQQPAPGSASRSKSVLPSAAGTPIAAGSTKKRKGASENEIDAIMRGAAKKSKTAGASGGPDGAAKPSKAAATAAAAAAAAEAARAEALRRERKLFMSHKASKVHEVASSSPAPAGRRGAAAAAAADGEEAGLTPEEFQRLHLEVEKFAAASLDKKAAKQYKARMLARVGAKADTAPRTALSIGKGMAQVAAKRQARALEEAIEAGMVSRKGLGKKKRATAAKNRDRGLMEAGPSFKNGILRVKPMAKARNELGKLRLPKGVL
ncbi:hypothetical protein HXX76_002634 [Chlamydomonas incerta]|uniref:Uncharacterized protein n=1 Tax=Chlamydomonas incerta TaxID=51695 RepID=A0A835TFN2_CHLIN|nr:hypothetical protein HXX76_002634 [Chlamydomonas incerta]|eukprot:KAG2442548.1 hypothetical protein HXX76_002634 [Chlamydomonas incerta]